MRGLGIGCLLLALAACAGLSQPPPTSREALRGLATSAAQGLLASPPWSPDRTASTTILMRPAEVDEALPISAAALNEALGRALLSREDSPHVLDWVPNSPRGAMEDQWLLQARLSADAPPLRLSDRTLQPYTLQFDLSRPSDPASHWQWQASGALDLDALPAKSEASP
ncbi:hypothetical protein [Salinicola peritrichatus]|uniref:hypothetical protein n=1 Tax=Salinicola peritrichatus TaxID=1267424 RepID=UPI0013A68810|nr:hypothetical protein [Salinicola peritrichatus]